MMSEIEVCEGELSWFSPAIPEEDYEILIGDTNILEILPLDEREENRWYNGRIGPWYKLKGKRVKLTVEVIDEV
jgi:hypothetical protein